MAECYSSTGAPLTALANQLLGESSFSAKSSLFRSSQQQQQQQQQHQHQQHSPSHHHGQRAFPRHYQQQPLSKDSFEDFTSFEQSWSTPSNTSLNLHHNNHHHPHHHHQQPLGFDSTKEFNHYQQQRHIPDLDLITAWDQQEHLRLEQERLTGQFHQLQSTVSGVVSVPTPEFSTVEYENFKAPVSPSTLNNNNDSAWASEWSRQQGNETDDDDDGDEFREEWSNENFTQAYINNHQLKFQEIEEQDRLKEARLEEERERQRQASGGPPRNTWMMAGAVSTITETPALGPKRLRVPGLDSFDTPSTGLHPNSDFCVSEFMNFDYNGNTQQPQLQQSNPAPIRSVDRFLSLVSDLHTAEQIYYPGATSATNPDQSKDQSLDVITPETSSGWAQEFATEDRQRVQLKKFTGAEWNWEKLFGKDPRKQNSSTLASSCSSEREDQIDESDRLRTVALARLQALFGHLSLVAPNGGVDKQ